MEEEKTAVKDIESEINDLLLLGISKAIINARSGGPNMNKLKGRSYFLHFNLQTIEFARHLGISPYLNKG